MTKIISDNGSCYLSDGTCIHESNNYFIYLFIGLLSFVIFLIGLYLIFFYNKSKSEFISNELLYQKLTSDEKFDILLKGLSAEEQLLVKAIREQDGITQETLRFRVDMHKSKLSIVLSSLEKKGIIKRTDKGKTKQIHLKILL